MEMSLPFRPSSPAFSKQVSLWLRRLDTEPVTVAALLFPAEGLHRGSVAWRHPTIIKSSRLSPLRLLILVTVYTLLFVKWQSLLIWQIQSHIVAFLSVCVATCGSAFLNVNCKVLLISN